MPDSEDFDGIAEVVEASAVIAEAEAEFWRIEALQSLDVAFSGSQEACDAMQKLQRGLLIDGAHIGPGLVGPDNLLRHR